jgi:hypothetical protein
VRGVRHELALCPLPPLALGDIGDDENGQLSSRSRRNAGERVRPLLVG